MTARKRSNLGVGWHETGYWTEVVGPYTRVKLTEFNPSSRHHIADRLKTLRGWVPEEFTKDGHPKVDDIIISQLPYPEAPQIATYLMVEKRIGQLAEGNEAWLRLVQNDGRIHGQVNGIGTITFRCTHYKPNVTQVPKVLTRKGEVLTGLEGGYGAECRELFYAPEGFVLVGADASGLELRMPRPLQPPLRRRPVHQEPARRATSTPSTWRPSVSWRRTGTARRRACTPCSTGQGTASSA